MAPPDLVTFLAPYPPEVQELFLAGRALLLRRLKPVVEMHYDATTAVGAGFAYTGDLKGLFVNLAAFSDHVTLVFAWGVKLRDPEGRLRPKRRPKPGATQRRATRPARKVAGRRTRSS